MFERRNKTLTATLLSSAVMLAVAALGCSDSKTDKETTLASAPTPAPAPARERGTPTPAAGRKRATRSVRTEATIARLDDTTIDFRLADGTPLAVARSIVLVPGADRQQRREERRLKAGDAKPAAPAAAPASVALAAGQSHSLVIRYDADGKAQSVRIRRSRAAKAKDPAR